MIWSLFFGTSCASSTAEPKAIAAAEWDGQHFKAPDGTKFSYTTWLPKGKPKSVILAVHGLSGAASDWWPLGEHFKKQGVAVYSYELRGMGNDPEKARRGDLADPVLWFDDFTAFALRVQAEHPRTPIVWYGESLGGIITLNMLQRCEACRLTPSAYVLASPIVAIDGKIGGFKEALFKTMIALQPKKRIKLQELGGEKAKEARVVSQTTHQDQMAKTPHAVEDFSLRLLGHIAKLVRENKRVIQEVKVPTLLLYSGHDIFTQPQEVEGFFQLLPEQTRKDKEFYPEGYHLLLHDVDRARVLTRVEKWLGGVLPKGTKKAQSSR